MVELVEQVAALVANSSHSELRRVGALANVAALLYERVERINWVGFYLTDESGKMLLLGPFQGKVACTEIPFERGVCGQAARTGRSVRVEDVHDFADHIVCDAESRSELVIPLMDKDYNVVGVLDIDSPYLARFSKEDEELFNAVGRCISTSLYGAMYQNNKSNTQ